MNTAAPAKVTPPCPSPLPQKSPRLPLLDALRGLTLLSMILFHTVWDVVYLFDVPLPWYTGLPGEIWQQSICWIFLILSGFCWSLGRHPLRRGLIVSAGGIVISVVTLIAMPRDRIIFGILTLLGCAMLLTIPLSRLFRHIPPAAGLTGCFVLFLLSRHLGEGYLGFPAARLYLPDFLYTGYLGSFFGFRDPAFFSTDYFPIFPWIYLFFAGFFLFRLWDAAGRKGEAVLRLNIPFFGLAGRFSLWIYLLHQPAVYLLLTLVFMLIR